MSLQSEAVVLALEKLRQTIKGIVPEAEEVISYGMPMFKYRGMLVGSAAFKNHCRFFPSSEVKHFKNELKDFKTVKGTTQFTIDKLIPEKLIEKIVLFRMGENEAKWEEKKFKSRL